MRSMYIFLICVTTITATAQNGKGNAVSKFEDPKMDWWKQARFGLFIHWGKNKLFSSYFSIS